MKNDDIIPLIRMCNSLAKILRMVDWSKHDPTISCPQETHQIQSKLQVKGQKTIRHTNSIQKRAGLAVLVSDKIDLKTKFVTRDNKEHNKSQSIRETKYL